MPGDDTLRFQQLLDSALPWIDQQLAARGMTRMGEPENVRIRTWSTVFAVPADKRRIWFKAPSRVTVHEVALYPLLVQAAPGLVLHPLATDPQRGWLLLPDGGTSLLRTASGDQLAEKLADLAPRCAELLRALASEVPAMLAMGVPDMRPRVLPHRFDEALTGVESIARQSGDRESLASLRAVAALRPRFEAWCERLDASTFPPTIDHSDLHANNILLPDGPEGPGRVYDWGDAVVAHPFASLLNMLRALTEGDGTRLDAPRIARVRDAYLEPFADRVPHSELLELVDAACWTSIVIRTLTWVRVLEVGPPTDPAWASAPLAWMKTLLNASWLD